MIIAVPDEIADEFLSLLNVAQSSLTDDDVDKCTERERACLQFVVELLGDKASHRWKTRQEASKASKSFAACFRS